MTFQFNPNSLRNPARTSTLVLASFITLSLTFAAPAPACAADNSAPHPLEPDALHSTPLSGTWRFQLDRENAGLQQRWFARVLAGKVKLPGSLPAQGIGDDISVQTRWTGDIVDKSWFTAPEYAKYRQPGNVKVPFWLQPDKYYAGVAWYQRDVEIPKTWQGKRIVLRLERPHWETHVWLDDRDLGSNNSLSTPHEYDFGTAVSPGKHRLTIRVDNGLVVDVGVNSHCITDHTQGNWNGIVGDISLRATAPLWFEDLQVYPHLASHSITVKGRIGNVTGQPGSGIVSLRADEAVERGMVPPPAWKEIRVSWRADGGSFDAELPAGAKGWDEFHPVVCLLEARIPEFGESKSVPFGMREISTQGTQLAINGRKIFIRGTLECCIFPLTGHPPTDVNSWRHIMTVAKAHGLNLFRFHSYCPPEAAFDAADRLGFYLQVETCWANQSTTLGDGKPVDQWVYDETERILKAYGNHPSFILMPYGNEPGGQKANAFLAKYVDHFKAADPRRLWTSGSGWPQLAENQFHVVPDPRIQHWGAGLNSRINATPPETTTDYRDFIHQRQAPVISHEIGEWCVYPNFDEIPKYKAYLKPKSFEIFRDSLAAHRMADLAHKFLLASGKLQTLCYKEDIESALRTPGMAGFELLDLHDFPGQGTALVGVLDPFWDSKGYVTPTEYRRFCNSTVPLARLPKRVFTTDQTLEADIEVAHFGPEPLKAIAATWSLVGDDHKVSARGSLPPQDLDFGNGLSFGHLSASLKTVPAPARYKLVVTIVPESFVAANSRSKRLSFENDWDLWIYPAHVPVEPAAGVSIINDLNQQSIVNIEAGGKVLLLLSPNRVKGKVALGFSSIFWNTAWTGHQPPHTLGILCDPTHPALADFPTDYYSNWQWWYLISQAGAMLLDDLPPQLRPTIQVIDDWFTNRRLGLLFEAKVGRGRLMVCSIDLKNNLEANPVARQMLHSLLDYMAGPKFKPTLALSPEQIRNLLD